MTAEGIRCTEADLRAAAQQLGITSAADRPLDGEDTLAASDLTNERGALTATAREIVPLLTNPPRLINVSSVRAGNARVNSVTVVAPLGDGPFVFRQGQDDHVQLVVATSQTEAAALLDDVMMISAMPSSVSPAEIGLDQAGWLGLLAAASSHSAARREQQQQRRPYTEPTFGKAFIEEAIGSALTTGDAQSMLGALALVDRPAVVDGAANADAALGALTVGGLVTGSDNTFHLTESGKDWAEALSDPFQISHIAVVAGDDGSAVETVAMTFVRSPMAIVLAEAVPSGVTVARLEPASAAARMRSALDTVVEPDIPAPGSSAQDHRAETAPEEQPSAEWVYVLDPTEVRDLHNTNTVAGVLQPGTWYLYEREDGGWARVSSADGTLNGWAPAAQVYRQSEPPPIAPPQATPPPDPVWIPDQTVPADGTSMWAIPDPTSAVVDRLPGNTQVHTAEVRGAWAKVRTATGTEGWVDGRRLVEITDQPTPETTGVDTAVVPVASAPVGPADPVVAMARSKPVQLVAALAVAVSAFLPWFGDLAPTSDLPIAFLWSLEPDEGVFSIALLILVVGIGAVATVLSKHLSRFQRIAGGIATGIAAVWLIQTFRVVWEWEYGDFGPAVADMFTEVLSIGPWMALAAGITLLVKR